MNARTEPRFERRKDARPHELIEAALDLFVQHGYAATRLEDVAAKAGVSKGTLYLYFGSKEELFKAVVQSNVVPLIAQAEQLMEHFAGTCEELFRAMVMGWWAAIGDSKASGLPKLVVSEAQNFPEVARWYHDTVIARGTRVTEMLIRRGIERGEFRDVDVDQAVHVVMAPLLMFAIMRHSFGACLPSDTDPVRYLECAIDLTLAGLRREPRAPVPYTEV
jgi:AcrR family transcriptional regulator